MQPFDTDTLRRLIAGYRRMSIVLVAATYAGALAALFFAPEFAAWGLLLVVVATVMFGFLALLLMTAQGVAELIDRGR